MLAGMLFHWTPSVSLFSSPPPVSIYRLHKGSICTQDFPFSCRDLKELWQKLTRPLVRLRIGVMVYLKDQNCNKILAHHLFFSFGTRI